MNYSERTQKMVNRLGTVLISYLVAAIAMLILRGWEIFDIIGFVAAIIIFCGIQFLHLDKKIVCVLSIILGFFSILFVKGLLSFILSILLIIYSIILIVKLIKD